MAYSTQTSGFRRHPAPFIRSTRHLLVWSDRSGGKRDPRLSNAMEETRRSAAHDGFPEVTSRCLGTSYHSKLMVPLGVGGSIEISPAHSPPPRTALGGSI